jgi:hypothetical protein
VESHFAVHSIAASAPPAFTVYGTTADRNGGGDRPSGSLDAPPLDHLSGGGSPAAAAEQHHQPKRHTAFVTPGRAEWTRTESQSTEPHRDIRGHEYLP